MVCLALLAPATTAADATGFSLLKRYLDGREPALPEGCVHAHYLPHTLRAAHGSWFGFCRAEGDLDASEERVVERFGAWLGMLETTNLNKSYKMVVLRVLLDRDALWDGLEIPRLAAVL